MVPPKRNDHPMGGSDVDDSTRIVDAHGDRPTEIDACKPRGDPSVLVRGDHVEPDTTIEHRAVGLDEAGFAEEAELPGRGRPTQPELGREARWPPGRDRKRGDDPSSGRISQKFDPRSVAFGHDGSSMPVHPTLALYRTGEIGFGRFV